jgi:diguanylate cyclase (GGDEF)-like protein
MVKAQTNRRYMQLTVFYMILYYSVLFLCKENETILEVADAILFLTGLFLLMILQERIRKRSIPGERFFWLLVQFSFLMFFIAEFFRKFYLLFLYQEISSEDSLNILYLLSTTTLILSIFYLVIKKGKRLSNIPLLLDLSIISISIFTVGWGFMIYPALLTHNPSIYVTFMSVWYPLTDIGLLIAFLFIFWIRELCTFSIYGIVSGMLLLFFTDISNMLLISNNMNKNIFILQPLWLLCFAFITNSGLGRKNHGKNFHQESEEKANRTINAVFMYLPYVTLSVLIIIMLAEHRNLTVINASAAVCNFFIILKQLHLLLDNNKKINLLLQQNAIIRTDIDTLENGHDQLKTETETQKRLAETDSLTNTYNRKYMHDYFNQLKSQMQGNTSKYSIAMLDIDNFKEINDEHGHFSGDAALCTISGYIKEYIRGNELLIRYGGDEFCIVFPETSADDTLGIAERIRGNIESRKVPIKDVFVRCTVSIGISEWNINDNIPENVMCRADSALYMAKRRGKNQCCLNLADDNLTNEKRSE